MESVSLSVMSACNGVFERMRRTQEKSPFGVGTLPNLLAAGWALSRMKRRLEAKAVRWAAGAIVAVFALAGLWRALFVPASLGAGPFCLT